MRVVAKISGVCEVGESSHRKDCGALWLLGVVALEKVKSLGDGSPVESSV